MGNFSERTRDEYVMIILWVSISLYILSNYYRILAKMSSKNFALSIKMVRREYEIETLLYNFQMH